MSKDSEGNTGMVLVSAEEMLNRLVNCDFVEALTIGAADVDLSTGTMTNTTGNPSRGDYYAVAIRNLDPDNSISALYITVKGSSAAFNHSLPPGGETGIMPPILGINGSGNATPSTNGARVLVFWLDKKVYDGTAVDKGRINL